MNKLRKLLQGTRNRVSPVPIVAVGLVIFWGVVLFRPVSEPSRPPAEDKPPTVSVQSPAQDTTGETAGASTDMPTGEVLGDDIVASAYDETMYESGDMHYYSEPAAAAAPASQVSRSAVDTSAQQQPAPSPQPSVTPAPSAPPQTQPTSPAEPVQPPEEQQPRITTTVFSLVCSVGICL